MTRNSIILLVIAGMVIFIIGGGLGFFSQQQTVSQAQTILAQQKTVQAQNDQDTKVLTELSSKIVPLQAIGSVTRIEGKNITLSSNGDAIVIPISNKALIFSYNSSASGVVQTPAQSSQFDSIKVGDQLSITLKLLDDNTLEGEVVAITRPVGFVPVNSSNNSSNKGSK